MESLYFFFRALHIQELVLLVTKTKVTSSYNQLQAARWDVQATLFGSLQPGKQLLPAQFIETLSPIVIFHFVARRLPHLPTLISFPPAAGLKIFQKVQKNFSSFF